MHPLIVPEVDIKSFAKDLSNSPTAKQLWFFQQVHGVLGHDDVDLALEHLRSTLGLVDTSLDVTSIASIDHIVELLDTGAYAVFVTKQQYDELQSIDNLDQSRLVLSLPQQSIETLRQAVHNRKCSMNFKWSSEYGPLASLQDQSRPSCVEVPVYIQLTAGDHLENVPTDGLKHQSLLIVPANQCQFSSSGGTRTAFEDLILSTISTDREDGLYSTLVTNERAVALGLVYSSQESILESLRAGTGVYHSRKRGLWRKGESSGDTQELVNITLDCDSDCLRFTVRQQGKGKRQLLFPASEPLAEVL